ncbi:MAG: TonB family protein [Verrucomicrobia bacterium]|nr:TonB family protein [Verrucomicrobiota bacterium]
MNRDSIIAFASALICHLFLLFGFKSSTAEIAPQKSETYVEVDLLPAPPQLMEVTTIQPASIAAALPAEVPHQEIEPPPPEEVVPEPVPEPPEELAIEPDPMPIVVATEDQVLVPQEIAPIVAPIEKPIVESTNRLPRIASAAEMPLPGHNLRATEGHAIGVGKGGSASTPEIEAAYLKQVKPIYPLEARRLKQEGKVVVNFYINASGKVDKVELHESSGHSLLDQAALAAAQRSRLRPAYINNRPVNSKAQAPFWFVLKQP